MQNKICKNEYCKKEFQPYSNGQVFCSPECRKPNLRELISKSGRKKRLCLCCNRLFLSDGPHNRRCIECKRAGVGLYVDTFDFRTRGRTSK